MEEIIGTHDGSIPSHAGVSGPIQSIRLSQFGINDDAHLCSLQI